ncbi:hypothetical protein J6590_040476 [Homalodisca vitripennis]|nr:hypothetical protein J6590_040476 [Homalodisca vitripennis]
MRSDEGLSSNIIDSAELAEKLVFLLNLKKPKFVQGKQRGNSPMRARMNRFRLDWHHSNDGPKPCQRDSTRVTTLDHVCETVLE